MAKMKNQRKIVCVLSYAFFLLIFCQSVQPSPLEQNKNLVVLRNNECSLAISLENGSLYEGRDTLSNTRVIGQCNDRYRIEKQDDVINFLERYDSVTSYKEEKFNGRPAIFITCSNPVLPSLVIEKRYVLGPGKVFSKQVAFSTSDPKGFFVEYTCDTKLDPEYRSRINYVGNCENYPPSEPPAFEPPDSDQPRGSGVVTSKDFTIGLAGYTYSINNRSVPRRGNITNTSTGWREKVFIDYLKAGEKISAEVRWVIFEGDFTVFERYRQNLPEWKKFFDYQHSSWLKRLANDVMYLTGWPEQQQFLSALSPLIATETIWFLNPPWGNWGAFDDPPKSLHYNVSRIASDIRGTNPNTKVSAYTVGFLFDENSVVYRNHPDFAVTGRDGKPKASSIASDAGGATTFYKQLLAPGCREFFINQYRERLSEWKLDFVYIDGPFGPCDIPDWKLLDVCQSYDWIDYYQALRTAIQEENPEAAIFTNGTNFPFTDIGYIEWRDDDWRALAAESNWQSRAYSLLVTKLNEPEGHVTVTLYGQLSAEPAYTAYTLAYGWCPMGQEINKIPFAVASWEFRGSKLVEDVVEPRWWRTGDNFEAYGLQKGKSGLITIISHYGGEEEVKITVNPAKLDLEIGKPFWAYLLKMNDPRSISKKEGAFTTQKLLDGDKLPETLEITILTEPTLLQVIVLTQTPAVLESVNGKRTQTGLTEHPDVQVSGQEKGDIVEIEVNCQTDNCTIVVPGLTTKTAEADIGSVEDTTWAGASGLRISLNRGKHSVSIKKLVK